MPGGDLQKGDNLDDAEALLAEGIFRSLKEGVYEVVAAVDGLAETQDKLLGRVDGLLSELRQPVTRGNEERLLIGANKLSQACTILPNIGTRLAALQHRAKSLAEDIGGEGQAQAEER